MSNRSPEEEMVMEETVEFMDVFLSGKYVGWTVAGVFLFPLCFIPPAIAWMKAGNHRVRLTTQRIIVESGLFSTEYEEIELYRVKDSSFSKGTFSRRGTVKVVSTDATAPVLKFKARNARELREKLRDLVNAEKERRGVSYREDV